MASIIKILPQTLANKIAAGEVIQRPASAVKELIENAIDANARSLTVIIKDAGKQLIQIVDDGVGMGPEDASLAFERHATSKISSYEDLVNIKTLGFRGEALASIAAVSQVELKTRRESEASGTAVRIEGGIVMDISDVSTPVGTSISVKNLFYNTPARRNFLKSTNTEFKHIFDIVQRAAISHPELYVTMYSNDEQLLKLRPQSREERVKEIFGEKLTSTLFYFEEENDLFRVSGFLGKPDFARKSRIEQYLFLNGRYIISRAVNHAVFQAYEHLLEKGSFPFFILSLSLHPTKVDVNVHPSKMEVKFEDESSIYKFILSAVRRALSGQNLIPAVEMRQDIATPTTSSLRFNPAERPVGQRVTNWQDLLKRGESQGDIVRQKEYAPDSEPLSFQQHIEETFDTAKPSGISSEQTPSIPEQREALPVWQLHNKYIIIPTRQGLMVIDQHAAHERVLYERAVARFADNHSKTQQLLFPHTIEFSPGDIALIQQLIPSFESLGFTLKVFGKNVIMLDGVPIDVKPGDESTILQNMLDLFKQDEQSIKLEPREKLAKTYSCKAAVKAGDPLNEPEMRSLLDQLFATEVPFVCPHGRPVMMTLSLAELDRRFGRTS